jgi:hypothetical protein
MAARLFTSLWLPAKVGPVAPHRTGFLELSASVSLSMYSSIQA